MSSKTETKEKRRRTTMVPVTTMVEIPVLSEKERTELLTSLKKAEVRAKANKATDYDPKTFKDRLIGIYRGGKR
jgi:hypothetical protein